ncbi:MAG TPA: hypothetical protein VN419_03415 [Humidesulfovibrio sp.]|uniref:hypothetical protein n=1 Tax=Humidesulfovibrio sp. TaxID=2910988 RepID=UPI002BF54533|nr:hypothetical protein [Humidesulfovibrio sp.]HWR03047.1 hypothetical protein [Humidesulfovibrio sp.]
MLIVNKSLFRKGLMLMASFLCIFASLFMPIWGGHGNGLDAADNMFNRLSKGSSYFIPGVKKQALELEGKSVTITAKVKDAKLAARAVENLTKAGATAEFKDDAVTYTGDLGKILGAALQDADDLFNDHGQAVLERYAVTDKDAEKTVVKAWWSVLDPSIKELQKQKLIQEAKVVGQVNKRGLEPGYNFYGIKSEKVLDNVLPLVGLLVFYVIYTMWYGYAIFDMFGGIGLGMSKPKIKKEA